MASNTLILHSARISLVNHVVDKYAPDGEVYVLTHEQNRGQFAREAKELFFHHGGYRISAFKVWVQIRQIIKSHGITRVVGLYNNVGGEQYQNVRVLMSLLSVQEKVIIDANFHTTLWKVTPRDYLKEFYLSFELELLPFITGCLKVYRRFFRRRSDGVKRVLFISDSYTIGGLENLIYQWGSQLSNRFNVAYIAYSNGDMFGRFQVSPITPYIVNPKCTTGFSETRFFLHLFHVLRREKPDVIILAKTETVLSSMIAAVLCGVPKVIKMNNGLHVPFQAFRPLQEYFRRFSCFFNSAIAISKSVYENMVQMGIPEDKVRLIYGSTVDVEAFNKLPINPMREMENCLKNITCVSRLSPEKGIEVFVEAIHLLRGDIRQQCHFFIVGDGSERERLQNRVEELSLESCITFMGFQDDIRSILHHSYLTVLPSHTEGLGISLLESMAAERMCIGSNVGGIPEIIDHEQNGLLFHKGSAEELARCIERCVSDETMVKHMSSEAYSAMRRTFDINAVMDHLIRLIEGE